MCRSHHLVNAHEVKPVRLIQSLCAVCGSNLAGLTILYTGWAKKVIPLLHYITLYERYHFFWPTLYSAALHGGCCVPPCVADVSTVNCAVCQQFNKRTLLLSSIVISLSFHFITVFCLYIYFARGSGCEVL